MGLFDEQIQQRKQKDQELFEDSMFNMAASVLGTYGATALRDDRIITKAAIDEILKYYHYKGADIPASVKSPKDQIEYALRPHGLMYRSVTLSEGWYRRSFGPILAYMADDGMPVVLLPKTFGGYAWRDKDGSKVTANKKTAAALIGKGCETLAGIKSMHDDLERLYTRTMDFAKLEGLTRSVIDRLDAFVGE